MKRYQNLVMILAVVALVALPLWMVKKPAPGADGREITVFAGSDDTAKNLVGVISPDYKPWFKSPVEPPGGEITSLLFALQAALGAGFIGYWYGCSTTRAKQKQALQKEARC
ncbi:MAG TPA: energy-coupling factor ABC transporter substrate-binding protein [Desulfuromonadales bacterium]|nr:energy-coupling factor ABC transporter substrate-binding protein [Desulfuromonadales bacterium]